MGTTAEKLKYLNETKAEIKNALETPYNVMRDYPELIKKYIDNQPTKVVTDGICGNAVDVPVKAIEINGNIRQETTEGYNLFDKSTANIGKTLNAQGELQGDSGGGFSTSDYIQIEPNTNYYLYNVLPDYYVRTCGIYDDNKGFIRTAVLSGSNVGNLLILTPANAKYIRITYKTSDVDIVQVTKGINLLPYEPYTGKMPSPSPDYPQNIEVINGVNLFDKNKVTTGWLNQSGNIESTINYCTSDFIKVEEGKNYYIPARGTTRTKYYKSDKSVYSNTWDVNEKEQVITIPNGVKYIRMSILITGSSAIDINTFQFVKGTTKKPYIPYGCIGLQQSGKNWFDESYYSNKTLYKDEGIYFTAAEMPDSFKTKFYGSGFLKGTDKDLVFGFSTSKSAIPNRILGGNHVLNKNVEYDFTNADKVYFVIGNGNRININTDIDTIFSNYNIMVTTTEATPYEPYHEPIITPINLQGNILSKVGDVKDILKVNRNGEVEIKKNIGKVVLDGSESWNPVYSKIYNNMCLYDTPIVSSAINKNGILCSNNFTYSSIFNEYIGEVINLNKRNGRIGIALNSSRCPNYTTVELKTWLSQHPTEVYYPLATPQIITLPSISPIELWQGTNIFKLITNLDTDFEVEYVVDKDSVTKEEE